MYNLIKLHQLVKIDLSNNHILSIEGLKELRNLKYLNLSNNSIKVFALLCVSFLHLFVRTNKPILPGARRESPSK